MGSGQPTIEARRYLDLWTFADEVCSIVGQQAKIAWPDIPLYVSVDHFWHWIKEEWSGFDSSPHRRDLEWRRKNLPIMFNRFITYDKRGDQHSKGLPRRLSVFKKYLALSKIDQLTMPQIQEVYRNMNCSGMRIQRFDGDKELALNSILKIRNSLKYLLYSHDEIEVRIHRLMKDPEYKLKGFGESAIKEVIGWVHHHKMPMGNDKAANALKALGFKFR